MVFIAVSRDESSLQPASLGLLVTTRLERITEAFRTGLGAAKVYRLSVCKQRGVRPTLVTPT
jgi:hypothetical protein